MLRRFLMRKCTPHLKLVGWGHRGNRNWRRGPRRIRRLYRLQVLQEETARDSSLRDYEQLRQQQHKSWVSLLLMKL